ncbi:MAG: hypothetical protein JWO76_668 [Nocardioides sp.]|nr:hypothetical protein [Nocardioides sp.]
MFIDAGDHLLNTVQYGTGNRWFVAHSGWVGSWELWQQPMELMQEDWRSVAYDHRGSGVSTATAEQVSPEGLVEDLFTVLDHHGVDRCVLAGESMGAATCLQAVLADPDRFLGLVLVDGIPSMLGPAPDTAQIRDDYATFVHDFMEACVPESDSEHVKRWGRQILLRADPEAAARMIESHFERAIAPDLSQVSIPTLVIHGELDLVAPLDLGRQVASAIPDAELVVLDSGHVPTMTRPVQVVDAIKRVSAAGDVAAARIATGAGVRA